MTAYVAARYQHGVAFAEICWQGRDTTADVRVPIILVYVERGGDAQIPLAWACQARQVVPASQFYPATTPSGTPTMTPTVTPMEALTPGLTHLNLAVACGLWYNAEQDSWHSTRGKHMCDSRSVPFLGYFDAVDDPRVERTKLYPLGDILAIAICAIICGADTWDDIEAFGKAKIDWFRTFLDVTNGIPSHDTFNRVFTRICPEQFQSCFLKWMHGVTTLTDGQVIAIDGKMLRSSADSWDGKQAMHMVSAWASANRIILGQVKVDEKSNEITAIPALLRAIEIAGCIVTIDAMGCQKDIAATIIDADADYVLAVKENQPKLHTAIKTFFTEQLAHKDGHRLCDVYRTEEKKHGRVEIRTVYTSDRLDTVTTRDDWKGLRSIAMVVAERTLQGRTSTDRRYYISSAARDAQHIGNAARTHWGIENTVHWVLDVAFREDASRICKDHAPHNVAILRHIALNLLRQEQSTSSVRTKRLRAGWDEVYLAKVLHVTNMHQTGVHLAN